MLSCSPAVQRAFADRAVKEQPRPVEKRAPPPDDADDDAVVYADGEDPDDDKESWLDIVKVRDHTSVLLTCNLH